MFTPDFRKLRLVMFTLVSAAVIYGVLSLGLGGLAGWAERNGAYPYEGGEDPIRVLLPTIFQGRRADIMLTGPSTANEAFVIAEFERVFPDLRTLSMSLSTATLDDTLVMLDYIERVHGPGVMPRILVLGIGVRFIANIPRHFGPDSRPIAYAPLFRAIDRYSPYYRVEPTPAGSKLEPKNTLESLVARLRFLRKQQPRHFTAVLDLLRQVLPQDRPTQEADPAFPLLKSVRRPFGHDDLPQTLAHVRRVGPLSFFQEWLAIYRTPYGVRYERPMSDGEIRARLTQSWAHTLPRSWDPDRDAPLVRHQLRELTRRCRRLGVRLYVINLPEDPRDRELYPSGHLEAYLGLVRASLSDVPVLDLSELLRTHEFVDGQHATYDGARRVTERVIALLAGHAGRSVPMRERKNWRRRQARCLPG